MWSLGVNGLRLNNSNLSFHDPEPKFCKIILQLHIVQPSFLDKHEQWALSTRLLFELIVVCHPKAATLLFICQFYCIRSFLRFRCVYSCVILYHFKYNAIYIWIKELLSQGSIPALMIYLRKPDRNYAWRIVIGRPII